MDVRTRVIMAKAGPGLGVAKKILQESDEPLESGVVYVGHLPHGFYEEQLDGYFSQFGAVKKVKVARNKKSGRCKGYAFVEFKCDAVAKIAAQTMNNYLMFNKLLKCQFVERSKVHCGMLGRGSSLQGSVSLACRQALSQKQQNKSRTPHEHRKRINRLLQQEKRKRSKLIKMGIDYEFPGYAAKIKTSDYARTPTRVLFDP